MNNVLQINYNNSNQYVEIHYNLYHIKNKFVFALIYVWYNNYNN